MEVKQTVDTTLQQARRMNAPRAIALCQCFNGTLEFQAGRWAEAEAALRESIRLYHEIGAASGESLSCQRLGVLLTAQGRLEEGQALLLEGIAVAERAMMRAHCLARLYAALARNRLEAGDGVGARRALALGLAMGKRHGHCTTCDALLLPVAVSVSLAQGEREQAADYCRQLDLAASEYGSRTWVAMARQARGELAAALGDRDEAIACYATALENFEAAQYAYEAVRCLEALVGLYQARQAAEDTSAAQAARQKADAWLARLGVPLAA